MGCEADHEHDDNGKLIVPQQVQDMVSNFAKVYFDFDAAVLNGDSKAALDAMDKADVVAPFRGEVGQFRIGREGRRGDDNPRHDAIATAAMPRTTPSS